jgi:hypothetical protein
MVDRNKPDFFELSSLIFFIKSFWIVNMFNHFKTNYKIKIIKSVISKIDLFIYFIVIIFSSACC